jgi:hypothetical protein
VSLFGDVPGAGSKVQIPSPRCERDNPPIPRRLLAKTLRVPAIAEHERSGTARKGMTMENTKDTKLESTPPLPAPSCSVVDIAKRVPFKMVCHLNCGTEHVLEYLNEELNIACVIVTKYRNGNPGEATKTFGINERRATRLWHPYLKPTRK